MTGKRESGTGASPARGGRANVSSGGRERGRARHDPRARAIGTGLFGPENRPVVRFVVRCALYWGAVLAVVSRFHAIENAGIGLTLLTVHGVFGAIGVQVARLGDTLSAGGASVRIVSDCSPHLPYLLFAAVVLAFPATWRQRLLGLTLGAVAIHVFNTVRIVALIGILIRRQEWFEFAHVYLWQTGTLILVLAAFLLWLRFVVPRRSAAVSA